MMTQTVLSYLWNCSTVTLLILSLLSVGFALQRVLRSVHIEDLELPIAIALGTLCYACIGLLIAIQPFEIRTVSAVVLVGLNFSLLLVLLKSPALRSMWRRHFTQIALWMGVSFLALAVAQYPARLPDEMPDGVWVLKKDIQSVRVQQIAGSLPMDNVIPTVAGEYLFRRIGFRDERPILPGQEVTNRPISVSLIALPFRAVLGPDAPVYREKLPKFDYVGTAWPDFTIFIQDEFFPVYLAIGIVLNATLLIAFLALLKSFGVRSANAIGFLIFASSPFFLMQTVFTWPKSFAGFFIILGGLVLAKYKRPALGGAIIALGYWAHPYTIGFCLAFALWHAFQVLQKSERPRSLIELGAAMAIVILPWHLWSLLVVRIPTDLVAQNFGATKSLSAHLQARMATFQITMVPLGRSFAGLNAGFLSGGMNVTYWGVLGPIFGWLAIPAVLVAALKRNAIAIVAVLGVAILGAVFSYPSVIVLHGWQAGGAILLAITLVMVGRTVPHAVLCGLVALQVLFNLWSLGESARRMAPNGTTRLAYWNDVTVSKADAKPSLAVPVAIDGVRKQSMFTSAPAEISLNNMSLKDGDIISLTVGLHPEVYGLSDGDGATFRINLVTDGVRREIFNLRLDPARVPGDRGWKPVELPLDRVEGHKISVELVCDPGPAGNKHADWCIWGDPVIKSGTR